MAGGYDDRVAENVEHYTELRSLTSELDLDAHVTFLRSISDTQKVLLLRYCQVLLYTPDREHFGIVPIEAMYAGKPVVAVASGGPLETVADSVTGFLRQPEPEDFAEAMGNFVKESDKKSEIYSDMCVEAKKRVQNMFSFSSFTDKLDRVIQQLAVSSDKIRVD